MVLHRPRKPSSQLSGAIHRHILLQQLRTLYLEDPYQYFLHMVDPTEYPDYLSRIREPVWFLEIEHSIKVGKFDGSNGYHLFRQQLELLCANSLQYNKPNTDVHAAALSMRAAVARLSYPDLPPTPLELRMIDVVDSLYAADDEHKIFWLPVTEDVAPGYSSVVTNPKDLTSVSTAIFPRRFYTSSGMTEVESWRVLGSELQLIFDNCKLFNRGTALEELADQFARLAAHTVADAATTSSESAQVNLAGCMSIASVAADVFTAMVDEDPMGLLVATPMPLPNGVSPAVRSGCLSCYAGLVGCVRAQDNADYLTSRGEMNSPGKANEGVGVAAPASAATGYWGPFTTLEAVENCCNSVVAACESVQRQLAYPHPVGARCLNALLTASMAFIRAHLHEAPESVRNSSLPPMIPRNVGARGGSSDLKRGSGSYVFGLEDMDALVGGVVSDDERESPGVEPFRAHIDGESSPSFRTPADPDQREQVLHSSGRMPSTAADLPRCCHYVFCGASTTPWDSSLAVAELISQADECSDPSAMLPVGDVVPPVVTQLVIRCNVEPLGAHDINTIPLATVLSLPTSSFLVESRPLDNDPYSGSSKKRCVVAPIKSSLRRSTSIFSRDSDRLSETLNTIRASFSVSASGSPPILHCNATLPDLPAVLTRKVPDRASATDSAVSTTKVPTTAPKDGARLHSNTTTASADATELVRHQVETMRYPCSLLVLAFENHRLRNVNKSASTIPADAAEDNDGPSSDSVLLPEFVPIHSSSIGRCLQLSVYVLVSDAIRSVINDIKRARGDDLGASLVKLSATARSHAQKIAELFIRHQFVHIYAGSHRGRSLSHFFPDALSPSNLPDSFASELIDDSDFD